MLPTAVEKQAALAEELHKQAYGNPAEAAPDPKVEPKVELEARTEAPVQPEQQPKEAAPEQATQGEETSYWKNRFDVLEGKYRAEVPRYAEEIRQMRQHIAALEQQLSAQKVAEPKTDSLPEDLVQKYGEEFVADIQKLFPQGDTRLKEKVESVEQLAANTARREYFADLTAASPSWQQLNTDPGFLAWLAGYDDFTGRPRAELFDAANSAMDAQRVAAFFNAYGGSNQLRERAAPSLDTEVVPRTNRVTVQPAGKKIWNQSEIAKFYQDYRRGVISAADANRIEQDIFAAQREGRLRPA